MTSSVDLDAPTLRERLDAADPPRLLDVRTPAEFESAHIHGAHNVPLDLLRAHRDELSRHLDTDLVLICRSGPRARQAEQVLASAGVTGASVLSGGMVAWEASGGAVEGGRRVWDMDRQVRFTAGILVLIGLLGSLVVPALAWFSALIAAALVTTAALNICPMAAALARMPWNRGAAPVDVDSVVAGLAPSR